MGLDIKGNGSRIQMSGKVKGSKSGQMDLCMRVGGVITKRMGRGD